MLLLLGRRSLQNQPTLTHSSNPTITTHQQQLRTESPYPSGNSKSLASSRKNAHYPLSESMLSRASNGFRMWMPNLPMMMTSATNATATEPARAIFRVLPRMTKHEIKEYLTKIYG